MLAASPITSRKTPGQFLEKSEIVQSTDGMNSFDLEIFRTLIIDVFARATGGEQVPVPLSGTEANTLVHLIKEQTGRSISEKTLRTYVRQAFAGNGSSGPSAYHLETLAQYALGLSELTDVEGMPSWFKYLQQQRASTDADVEPAVVGEKKTESPAADTLPPASPDAAIRNGQRRRYWLWLLLLLPGSGLAWWINRPAPVLQFIDNFNRTNPDSLRAHGRQFLDYDAAWFARQPRADSMLTLWTLPGDYWVKSENHEKPLIKNLLVRRLEEDQCVISFRLVDFYPYQNWQSAGIFLFRSDLSRENWYRINFAYHYSDIRFYCSYLSLFTNCEHKIQTVLLENGLAKENHYTFRCPEFDVPWPAITIYVLIKGRKISVNIQQGHDWNPLVEAPELDRELPFTPAFIGLGAFQGFTDSNDQPLHADTIPAFFDYIKIEPHPM